MHSKADMCQLNLLHRNETIKMGKRNAKKKYKQICSEVTVTVSGVSPNMHPFNGPLSGTTRVSQYQKGKINLDFTEAGDSEWHQLGHMQVCISLQTDNHASTPPLSFLQARCPSCQQRQSTEGVSPCSIDHLIWILQQYFFYIFSGL